MAKRERKPLRDNVLFKELSVPVLYFILGVICIIMGNKLLELLSWVIGGAFIVAGLVFVIIFLTREAVDNINKNDMLMGMGAIAIGITLFIKNDLLQDILPTILGVLIIISGASKIQQMVNMIKLHLAGWLPTLFVAIINIAFGVVMVVEPEFVSEVIIIVIGAGLVFSALSDIVFTLYYDKQFKEKRPLDIQSREIPPEEAPGHGPQA